MKMKLNTITPTEPKDPTSIYKNQTNEEFSGNLDIIIVLCFIFFFIGFFFKIIEIPFIVAFILLSVYQTSKYGEINISSLTPIILMISMTLGITWFQQTLYINKYFKKLEN